MNRFLSFPNMLVSHGLELTRSETTTLQINVGLLCNQTCKHCHLNAGPSRKEIMDLGTLEHVAALAERYSFNTIDITGGAPELNPNISTMIKRISGLAKRLMIRCNLTCLEDSLIEEFKNHNLKVIGSLPSINSAQLETQRGSGVFLKSINTLQRLNRAGFGKVDTGLELDLVVNSTGAFFPAPQEQTEKKFRNDLLRKWGIIFNKLFTFANVPLGRFRSWLENSGNFDPYFEKLVSSFNPCTIEGLMCRNLISVSWNGYLYDCDFNLAAGIPAGNLKTHITQIKEPPRAGTFIAVSDHCYACTAGSGFT